MEVLEIAQVEMFCPNEIVIPAHRRSELLCVVWEGTCVERDPVDVVPANIAVDMTGNHFDDHDLEHMLCMSDPTVWHAGDWTGPVALQPDIGQSSETHGDRTVKDVVALSVEGVKVIILNMKDLHRILKSGSKLFRKYLDLKEKQAAEEAAMKAQMMQQEGDMNHGMDMMMNEPRRFDPGTETMSTNWFAYDSILEVLKCNSALAPLSALQKRHLESVAEGPRYFEAGQYLWQVGEQVEFAFLIVAGTATFAHRSDEAAGWGRRGSTGTMRHSVSLDHSLVKPEHLVSRRLTVYQKDEGSLVVSEEGVRYGMAAYSHIWLSALLF